VTFSLTTKPEKSSAEKATAARAFLRSTKLVPLHSDFDQFENDADPEKLTR
jgi:hypothetical protein